jgi:formamidopyrimidine-DNA glycosylase
MPEGPEIKMVADYLSEKLDNKIIRDIHFCSGQYEKIDPDNYDKIYNNFPLLVEDVYSKGKIIYITLYNENKRFYILHSLRLNSYWDTLEQIEKRWYLLLDGGEKIFFYDSSCLSTLQFIDNEKEFQKAIDSLGPDILTEDFNLAFWRKALKENKNKNITVFLMDQSIMSGIGNIIKSEALFYAKVSPLRKVSSLSDYESEKIFEGIRIISRFSYIVGDLNANLQIYGKKNAIKIKTPDGYITHIDEKVQV